MPDAAQIVRSNLGHGKSEIVARPDIGAGVVQPNREACRKSGEANVAPIDGLITPVSIEVNCTACEPAWTWVRTS